MKRFLFLLTLASCIACADKQKKESPNLTEDIKIESDTIAKIDVPNQSIVYEASTFDDPESKWAKNITARLKEMNDTGVFDTLYLNQATKLSDRHFAFLKGLRRNYKLLYVTEGSLFGPGNKDKAMLLYEQDKHYLSIFLYNGQNDTGGELYRDYKVENGLRNVNCHYSTKGTLDYQLASNIVYLEEDPEPYYSEENEFGSNIPFHIFEFTKRSGSYAPQGGCFSSKAPKKLVDALCIPTSFVYNNWECLVYNKDTDSFLIYYGQAFAD